MNDELYDLMIWVRRDKEVPRGAVKDQSLDTALELAEHFGWLDSDENWVYITGAGLYALEEQEGTNKDFLWNLSQQEQLDS